MNKETLHNIRLGIFVMAGILLLITGLYFIGSNTNMFSKTITLYVTFKNVSGLKAGNNIRYAGIDVGTVEDIVIVNVGEGRFAESDSEKLPGHIGNRWPHGQ